MTKIAVADFDALEPLKPAYALVAGIDLVVIRWQDAEHDDPPDSTDEVRRESYRDPEHETSGRSRDSPALGYQVGRPRPSGQRALDGPSAFSASPAR